jgi:hypothetical protein
LISRLSGPLPPSLPLPNPPPPPHRQKNYSEWQSNLYGSDDEEQYEDEGGKHNAADEDFVPEHDHDRSPGHSPTHNANGRRGRKSSGGGKEAAAAKKVGHPPLIT